jgi:virginiamycin A acetyltransferase
MKATCKTILDWMALVMVWPFAALVWLEAWLFPAREECFRCFGQWVALGPGVVGMYCRRAFYRWTLQSCSGNTFIGFGSIFSNRHAVVESGVYIGTYALIGSVVLRRNCLVGSRASLLSGGRLHAQSVDGDWLPTDPALREQIEIGENAWLGEGVIVMADVGPRAMLSAGAVVSAPVPERVMVAGNPARFVKRLVSPKADSAMPEPETVEPQRPVAILG